MAALAYESLSMSALSAIENLAYYRVSRLKDARSNADTSRRMVVEVGDNGDRVCVPFLLLLANHYLASLDAEIHRAERALAVASNECRKAYEAGL